VTVQASMPYTAAVRTHASMRRSWCKRRGRRFR
jgi:hypothetical protein